jgi:hypothetical protein
MPSTRRPGWAFLVCETCFLKLLSWALTSGRRFFNRRRDQTIVKPQSIEVVDSLTSPLQSLLLGLFEKRGALSVQLLDALDRCFVCHAIFPCLPSVEPPVPWRAQTRAYAAPVSSRATLSTLMGAAT